MNIFGKEFWSSRYQSGMTGWDVGEITTPLKEYFDQISDKSISILIPGAGNGYEAEYLVKEGFASVTVIDISHVPLQRLSESFEASGLTLIEGDFFEHRGNYDLIVEQTFFSAIHPSRRIDYCRHMLELLKKEGRLVGVLFDDPLFSDRPPFGGTRSEYQSLFQDRFQIHVLERCYNSIPARQGREVFVNIGHPSTKE